MVIPAQASAPARQPSFNPATVKSAGNDLYGVGTIVEIRSRQFAAPGTIDGIAYALLEVIGKGPPFNVTWCVGREDLRYADALSRRVSRHEQDRHFGMTALERTPISHILDARGAVN